MKIASITAALLLAASLSAQPSPDSRKAQGLIQAAQAKESVQGDLKGAVELYRRAAREAGPDHATATRALLAAAGCYEKQGASEARKVYEEILAKYPGQKEAVALARQKLGHSVSASTPSVRQLWSAPDVDDEGGVSPDGRWLTYAHWETGDLGLRDLQNGSHRLLTNEGGWIKSGGAFAEDSLFSPDGKLIAYNWFSQKKDHEIRIVNFDGSGVRTVFGAPGWVVPQAWSSDGKTLGVIHFDREGRHSIYLVPVTSGEPRQVLTKVSHFPWEMSFSPDGRWLAFDMAQSRGEHSDIYILPTVGGTPKKIVDNAAVDVGPVWSPDGKSVRFLSNRTGSFGLYEVPVSDGKATGPARLIKPDLGARIFPIGFARSGSYFYSLYTGGEDLYEVDYDPATAKVTSEPRFITDRNPGRNHFPAYSPDGNYLAYMRRAHPSRGDEGLVVRDLRTGAEQVHERKGARQFTWSPDSRAILLESAGDEPNTLTISSFDLASNKLSELAKLHPTRHVLSPQLSADGKTLYYLWREWAAEKKETQVVALDLASREKRVLHSDSESRRLYILTLTPDGKHLGVVREAESQSVGWSNSLLLLPVNGGEPRLAATWKSYGGDFRASLSFTTDGKSAIVRADTSEAANTLSDLLRIELASGKVTPLDVARIRVQNPSVHPSGRKIVFKAGAIALEIWTAENILPRQEKSK